MSNLQEQVTTLSDEDINHWLSGLFSCFLSLRTTMIQQSRGASFEAATSKAFDEMMNYFPEPLRAKLVEQKPTIMELAAIHAASGERN